MPNKLKYSDYLDTIIALISHLAMSNYQSRTIVNLAKDIGIERDEADKVLNGFPGLFRKAINKSNEEDNYYTLQMRYARRWRSIVSEEIDREDHEQEETLLVDDKYISLLFEFVTNMVNQEKEDWRNKVTNIITIIASIIAFIASIIAIIISIANI